MRGVVVDSDVRGTSVFGSFICDHAVTVVVLFPIDRIEAIQNQPQTTSFGNPAREEWKIVEHIRIDLSGLDEFFFAERLAVTRSLHAVAEQHATAVRQN